MFGRQESENVSTMDLTRALNDFMLDESNASSSDEQILQMYISGLTNDPPMISQCMKNNESSVMYKEIGDENMEHYSYKEALSAYTDALRFAHPYSTMAGTCFAQRSLTLLKLGEHEESLSDVERALRLPISEKLKLELAKRKERLTKNVNRKQPNEAAKKSSKIKPTLTLSHGESKEISGASSAIGISYNVQFGRHIVATKPIKAGDVLLIQRPYALMVDFSSSEERIDNYICDNCLNFTKAPIPCDWCSTTLYCSVECRSEALQSHREIECKLPSLEGNGLRRNQFMRIFKIVTNNGASFDEVKRHLEDILKCEDTKKAGFVDGRLVGTDVRAFLSLVDQDCGKVHRMQHIRYAAILAFLLRNKTDFLRGNNDVLGLAKFMFHLCNIIQINFNIVGQTKTSKIGIYPVFHLLKHSCVSNTISYSPNDNCKVLRASRDIEPGEQIFLNYLRSGVPGLEASKRKFILKLEKNYVCHCIACKCNYTFKSEVNELKIPEQLRFIFVREPASIKGLWELLNLLHRKISRPCGEIEVIKRALENTYEGKESDYLPFIYSALGIF